MNTNVWKCMLLLLWLGFSIPIFAQRKNLIMYHDSVSGRDTILTHVTFLSDDSRKMQYNIKVRLKDGVERTFSASEIVAYREGKNTYYSKQLEIGGELRKVLLKRVYDVDSIAIYPFIQDDGKRKLYAEIGRDSLLMPFVDENNPTCINLLLFSYLKEFSIAQNEVVGRYFDGLKPTVGSFERRHLVAYTGNPNYITRFRWGIMLGASMAKPEVKPFSFGSKLLGFGGLFADVPLYEGLSVRPEVTFNPYAFSSHQMDDAGETNAVYNRKDFTGTLLFRYTLRSVKGKWLPYAMFGPEINLVLNKSVESAKRWVDNEGFMVLEQLTHPQPKGTTLGVTAGLGAEYVLSSYRSLFFDVRYRYEVEEEGLRGICLTVSTNL